MSANQDTQKATTAFDKGANGIGWAVSMLKSGARIRRTGWPDKTLWIAYVEGSDWGAAIKVHPMDKSEQNIHKIAQPSLPFIVLRTRSGRLVPWSATQGDLLNSDWEMVA